ncbi:NAD kinase [Candidatus Symbiobacter mobilis]|uniref:NAD kinase n=1 Tax=Candidatus Symbiobacter mobilis CR TaxID=946483 RepID=U5N6Y7_9BURK|nr:NAD kinase [Candidatus Symbiobacter mobilis]AGX87301.1 kinase-like protein [Candidatus Symbiobacter mobilis CR]
MTLAFHRVGLVGKYHDANLAARGGKAVEDLLSVARFLEQRGCAVDIEEEWARYEGVTDCTSRSLEDMGRECDLVVVVGGDGTMLGVARQLAPFSVPLIGINQGRLGFITDISYRDFASSLALVLEGEYIEDHRCLIDAQVLRAGSVVFAALALNDVVVNRGATAGMVELQVRVDGHFVASQRADGLIVASATGSTAYNLSAGGPLLHPAVAGWVLAPIAPHTLSNRPIVLPNSSTITLEIVAGRDASASFDTQSLASLAVGDCIAVRLSEHRARFLHPHGWSYFDTLRRKLLWNERGLLP